MVSGRSDCTEGGRVCPLGLAQDMMMHARVHGPRPEQGRGRWHTKTSRHVIEGPCTRMTRITFELVQKDFVGIGEAFFFFVFCGIVAFSGRGV